MRYCRAIMILALMIFAYTVVVLTVKLPWIMGAGGLILLVRASRRSFSRLTAFGTARSADIEDIDNAGMLSGKPGLILGRVWAKRPQFLASVKDLFDQKVPPEEACERAVLATRKLQPQKDTALVKLSNAVHVAVFAPTGVGKGVSCIIPHLLDCPDSMVVIDPKGENYIRTAQRRRDMGQQIVALDPFRVVSQEPDTFNPLDHIDSASPLAIDDARALAEALVLRTGQEKDPHWADSAELWIGAMIAVAVLYGEQGDRSLQTIRTLLTNPHKMAAVIKLMCESTAWGGILARGGITESRVRGVRSVKCIFNRFA